MTSHERAEHYDEAAQRRMLEVARRALEEGVRGRRSWTPDTSDDPPELLEPRGVFVTLHEDGQLRGCVGSLTARGPLLREVARAAQSAAFADPRFPAVTADEVPHLDIHISILSESVPLPVHSQAELLERLRPGIDGVTLRQGHHVGTFLPDVWASLPEPAQFLSALLRKAGLYEWSNAIEVERYTTFAFP
ncbi:MAG: AmmeMemoRadiSam system protein A [Myxococcales bacterium]|nr:AmmeMemoRadiSam system protein A [Myxococcales bacterium]